VNRPPIAKKYVRAMLAFSCLVLTMPGLPGQERKESTKRTPLFFDPTLLDISLILEPPPADNSLRAKADIDEVRSIEKSRTPGQIASAQADDKEEDIFIFRNILGPGFNAEDLPVTAMLSTHVRNDSELVDPPLKHLYSRPRPYVSDSGLHPVCQLSTEPSYPSGHAMLGYLFGFTLVQIIPEKHGEIERRAEEYAHNRLICGVHYRSDLEASRLASATLFGFMLASPRYQRELESARQEIRVHLGLKP
jgi:acid phosphatase (class A)